MHRRLAPSAAGLLLLAAPIAAAPRPAAEPFMRGVVVSCPRAGQIWGTEAMSRAVAEIRQLGGEWIAIHPYAWISADGSIRHRAAAETGYLAEAVRRVRAHGGKMFWKPHLGYWGSFDWRGSIDFGEDEDAWRRFFSSYRSFIVDQARFAAEHGVELFAVGVEYERTVHREGDWRAIVAAVREVYPGPVTYAANWDGVDRVPFWDALDLIGVHAYFPLSDASRPTRADLEAGWRRHLDALERLSHRRGKPILFAEIGYNRAEDAARAPWRHGSRDSPENRRRRQLLMEVALEVVERQSFVAGMFWWKWMPGERSGRDFSLKESEARAALSRYWSASAPRGGRTTAR